MAYEAGVDNIGDNQNLYEIVVHTYTGESQTEQPKKIGFFSDRNIPAPAHFVTFNV
jgi:hypothetical protein